MTDTNKKPSRKALRKNARKKRKAQKLNRLRNAGPPPSADLIDARKEARQLSQTLLSKLQAERRLAKNQQRIKPTPKPKRVHAGLGRLRPSRKGLAALRPKIKTLDVFTPQQLLKLKGLQVRLSDGHIHTILSVHPHTSTLEVVSKNKIVSTTLLKNVIITKLLLKYIGD